MTLLQAKTKIEKEKLTRAEINTMQSTLPHADWLQLRGAINDLTAEKVIESIAQINKKLTMLETNHIWHIMEDVKLLKKLAGISHD